MATEKIKLKVTKAEFLDWYYSDSDDTLILGKNILSQLKSDGEASITVQDLFDDCGYIPTHIVSNQEDMIDDDADDDEVDEDKYEVELI